MAIAPAIGVVLVLVGLALFLVDLSVTNHGLPTAGAILALLAGGLALLAAGVPYSGVLLGALGVVAVLMGGVLFGVLRSSRALRGRPAMTGREGMIGEVGPSEAPSGLSPQGGCSCTASGGGLCWRSPQRRPAHEVSSRW
jgi:membrane-bound serine protease (ClpP class)